MSSKGSSARDLRSSAGGPLPAANPAHEGQPQGSVSLGQPVAPIHLHHDGISRPLDNAQLVVLNLGVGLQSSTLLEMADAGEFGRKPDVAIFSDTKWEPRRVYDFLAYLEGRVSIPIIKTGRGSLRERIMKGGSSVIPAFVNGAPLNRNCTRDYKIAPIEREIRRMMGWTRRAAPTEPVVEQWFGITTDELYRVKRSPNKWSHFRYPLIEARMSRDDCERERERRGLRKAPWSSCVGCPWHGDEEWLEIKADPEAWADACEVDRALRDPAITRNATVAPQYLHRDCVPLDQVNFADPTTPEPQFGLMANECEGVCGV